LQLLKGDARKSLNMIGEVKKWNRKKCWYEEKHFRFYGIANITADENGMWVRFETEDFYRDLQFGGTWAAITATKGRISCYAGWSLSDKPRPLRNTES
jgi:hypothetical protein